MAKIEDGGPAFPEPTGRGPYEGAWQGMSLRDWFAGQALQGFLADGSQRLVAQAIEESADGALIADTQALARIVNGQIAGGCYAIAAAMLTERSKHP